MQLILFLLVLACVIGIIGLAHWYLWLRLVRDTTRPGRARRVGAVVVALLAVLLPATAVGGAVLPLGVSRWLAWPGWLWVGVFFYLLQVVALLEVPRQITLRVLRRQRTPAAATAGPAGSSAVLTRDPPEPAEPDPTSGDGPALVSRRLLLARSGAVLAGVATAGLAGHGVLTALGTPRITPVTVPLARLPAGLDGLRIAVVSDIHLGALRGRAHTERLVRMINEQRTDLVAIVGDLVDGTVEELGEAAAPLRDLVSTHGSFFVTGNHEYYSGAAPWIKELARIGVNPLVNERVELRAAGDPSAVLDLAGVNDLSAEPDAKPDFDRALGGRDDARPVVLLAHQPVQVDQAAKRGVDLQLSGHTHGGQIFPFHLLVRLEQPVLGGLHRVGDTQLFVTNGAGFAGPPLRVGAPPEIAVVQLTTAG